MRLLFVLIGLLPLAAQTKPLIVKLHLDQGKTILPLPGQLKDRVVYVELTPLAAALKLPLREQSPVWLLGQGEIQIEPSEFKARYRGRVRDLLCEQGETGLLVQASAIAAILNDGLELPLVFDETSQSLHLKDETETLTVRARLSRISSGYQLSFQFGFPIAPPIVSVSANKELRIKLRAGKLELNQSGLDNQVVESIRFQESTGEIIVIPGKLTRKWIEQPYSQVDNRCLIAIEGDFLPSSKNKAEKQSKGISKIVLDPGHGGKDRGAIGPTGLKEKDVTLELANRLKDHLTGLGYQVILTRSDDTYLALKQRTGIANRSEADLLLSIHVNAVKLENASGSETYYLSMGADTPETNPHYFDEDERDAEKEVAEEDGDDLSLMLWDMAQSKHIEDSFRVARSIQRELNILAGIQSRGVKQAPLKVLKGATMPACLIEVAFISNAKEEEKLRNEAFLKTVVEAIGAAIRTYDDEMKRAKAPDNKEPEPTAPTPVPTAKEKGGNQ